MSRTFIIAFIGLAIIASSLVSGASPAAKPQNEQAERAKERKPGDPIDIYLNSLESNNNDELLPYEPISNRRPSHENSQVFRENSIKPSLNLERESSAPTNGARWPGRSQSNLRSTNVAASRAGAANQELPDSSNAERFSSIAHNSREVRLVGPNQKEVEMKDDVASKMMVAMDNLQKEFTDVWGQVNDKLDKGWREVKRSEVWSQMNDKLDKSWREVKGSEVWSQVNDKLDKGWTDFKSMVEGVVSGPTKAPQP